MNPLAHSFKKRADLSALLRNFPFISLELDKRFGELIGAGRTVAALYALELVYGVVDVHARQKRTDALRVASAASDKPYGANDIPLYVDLNMLRTTAFCLECIQSPSPQDILLP